MGSTHVARLVPRERIHLFDAESEIALDSP
jgi:hypothetical protein